MDYSIDRLKWLFDGHDSKVLEIIKEDLLAQQRQQEVQQALQRWQGYAFKGFPVVVIDAPKVFLEGEKILFDSSLPAKERMKWAKTHLTEQGFVKLIDFANNPANREAVLKALENVETAYQYVKSQLPQFMVEVRVPRSGTQQVWLVDWKVNKGVSYEIKFKDAPSRVLYIWFLLNAGKVIHHYQKVDEFMCELYQEMCNKEKPFKWDQSMANARTYVRKALVDAAGIKDDDENKDEKMKEIAPYIIDNSLKDERGQQVYALNLAAELIDTSVVESGRYRIYADFKYEDIIK